MAIVTKDTNFAGQIKQFVKNSKTFVKSCKKPSGKEFKDLIRGHLVGLCFLGFFGYIIKVIHIPINNIIAGTDK